MPMELAFNELPMLLKRVPGGFFFNIYTVFSKIHLHLFFRDQLINHLPSQIDIVDDQLLWNNFRAGDSVAYSRLINKYTKILFRYGIRFINDADFVKDCIQDVFFELWNRKDRINSTASVKSYLLKALRLRIFREKSKWENAEILNDDYCFDIEFNIENKLIQEQTSLENRIKIEQALNCLPKRQKEILYLRFYENLDHDRIALVMQLSKQSVYNLLHEAVNHLRKAWFEQVAVLLMAFFEYYL